jgi:hypothetical protein
MDLFIPPGGKTKNWYVRVYIPSDLHNAYGVRREFRQSTRTTDKVLAQARAAVFLSERAAELLQVRQAKVAMGVRRQPHPVTLNPHLTEHIAAIRLASLVGFDDEMREGQGDGDWDEHEEFIRTRLAAMKQILARRKDAKDYAAYRNEFLGEAEQYGYKLSPSDPQLDELILAMARADKRAMELMSRRSEGDSTPEDTQGIGFWLSSLLRAWADEGVAHLDKRTVSSYRARIEHFIGFVHDKPVSTIEQSDVYAWLRHLLNVEKHAPKTVKDGYLPALRALMQYSLSSGQFKLKVDPTLGVRVPRLSKAEAKRRERPRQPFPISYVNTLFSSVWYAGLNERKGLVSKIHEGGGARYWLPLIGLTQGLRPEEISQMTLLDVGMQSGVLSLQVTDEAEGQHTKNESSKRWVPVHPLLLHQGFETYVIEQREVQGIPAPEDAFLDKRPGQRAAPRRKAGRLFPELATDHARQANAFGKVFNRFIREKLRYEAEFVFYSFRHLWEDRRREAMSKAAAEGRAWPDGLQFQLSGRAKSARSEDEGSAAQYGKGFTPEAMAPYIAQLQFPSLAPPATWTEFMAR